MKELLPIRQKLWPTALTLVIAVSALGAPAARAASHDLTPAENNRIAEKFFQTAWNKGDFNAVANLLDAHVIDHSVVPGDKKGTDKFREIVGMFRHAMPDVHMTIGDMIYTRDRVIHRWTVQGTQTGTLFGVPATHKHLVLNGITLVRMHHGRIAERWTQLDLLGLMTQLGYKMVPPQAASADTAAPRMTASDKKKPL